MKWSGFRSLLLVALVVAAVAGCAENPGTTPTPPVLTTETFTGTLANGAATYFNFIGKSGNVTATLTALTPDTTLKMTMTLGVYDSYYLTCQPISGSDAVGVGNSVVGLATATTSLCVTIGDPAQVIPTGVTESFTIKVEHY